VPLAVAAGGGNGGAVRRGKLRGEPAGVVTRDRQAGTPEGAVRGEGGQDDRAAGRQCGAQRGQVGGAAAGAGEEVEHGPVVPDLVDPRRAPAQQVGGHPGDAAVAGSGAGDSQRDRGDVHDRHVGESGGGQLAGQRGGAAAGIHDRAVFPGDIRRRVADQPERKPRIGLVPAHPLRAATCVHAVPVLLTHRRPPALKNCTRW